jgi:hypothetical protein
MLIPIAQPQAYLVVFHVMIFKPLIEIILQYRINFEHKIRIFNYNIILT